MSGIKKIVQASVSIEMINPDDAARLLDSRFEHQRNINKKRVGGFALEMRTGRWTLSPDAILIIDGELANGQHRLAAVRDSKVSCQFLVLRTKDKNLFGITDRGSSRSLGIYAKQLGLSYYSDIASAAGKIIIIKAYPDSWGNENFAVGDWIKADVRDFMRDRGSELEPLAAENAKMSAGKKFISRSIGLTLFYLAKEKGEFDKAFAFMSEVYGLTDTTPATRLIRNRLIDARAEASKYSAGLQARTIMALTFKAYIAYREKKDIKVLRLLDKEPLPVI